MRWYISARHSYRGTSLIRNTPLLPVQGYLADKKHLPVYRGDSALVHTSAALVIAAHLLDFGVQVQRFRVSSSGFRFSGLGMKDRSDGALVHISAALVVAAHVARRGNVRDPPPELPP